MSDGVSADASCADLAQRIVGITLWQLAIPVVSRRDHGIGSVAGSIDVVVLKLTAEGGESGFGEASPWSVFTGTVEASYAALERYLAPLVLGRAVADSAAIMQDARHAVAHCTEAKAALESALLDLQGRIAGVPVYALLGGRCRSRIPLSCSIANPDFDADKALLERLHADGVRIVKLKAGFSTAAFDTDRLGWIRQHFPQMDIRVDFNQGLSIEEAAARVGDVATFAPTFIEQPVRAHLYSLMARLRHSLSVPLLADESVFGPEDMQRAIREEICDGVSVKIMKSGGLRRAITVAEMAEAAGLSAYGGDMFETGLAHLAGVHMIAATPAIRLGCEFYQACYYLEEDLLETPFQVVAGEVLVPEGAGLGARPDADKLSHYAVRQVSSSATDSPL